MLDMVAAGRDADDPAAMTSSVPLPTAAELEALRNVPVLDTAVEGAGAVEGMAMAMLDASPDCIKYVKLDGTLSLMNANGMCAMQIDDFCTVSGMEWAALWPAESQGLVRQAVDEARAGRTMRFEAACPTAKGEPRWWDVTVAPVNGPNGAGAGPVGIVSVSRDVTASVRDRLALATAKEEAEIALREVNHRVKNLFMLVPAILQLSASTSRDVATLVQRVRERIGALARSHTLTLNAFSESEGVSLDALSRAVLEPYLDRSEAFQLAGPALRLAARDANTVSLVLHELATNAAKHGALSARRGRVGIHWRLEAADPGGAGTGAEDGENVRVLALEWQEAGGPAVAPEPAHRGFGTQLIDRLVEAHGGKLGRAWNRSGLRVNLHLPIQVHAAE